jgi:hypothetical protein
MRRERKDESYLLAATACEQVAIALIREETQMHADRIERKINGDVLRFENAQPFFSFGSTVLGSILEQVGRSCCFLRLD